VHREILSAGMLCRLAISSLPPPFRLAPFDEVWARSFGYPVGLARDFGLRELRCVCVYVLRPCHDHARDGFTLMFRIQKHPSRSLDS